LLDRQPAILRLTVMSQPPFPELPGGYAFPALELAVLEAWRAGDIFQETLRRTASGAPFVFFEGPPTANNVPHVGHVVTRVVKDLIPRYRTMRGFHVRRKAGWDTHGLAVEIEVEKRLGFTGKQQIEAYGIEAFNRACLDSVHTYEKQWRAMTERIGAWFDMDDAYFTYANTYIESVWWALSELHEKGLLVESYKIQPYCARCGTTLSSHEVAQNYKQAEDPSIWTLFRLHPDQRARTADGDDYDIGGAALVGWTTTPWTTLANAAVAVHPDLTYKLIQSPRNPDERLLIGEGLGTAVPLALEIDGKRQLFDLRAAEPLARFRGRDLAGLLYERLFTFFDPATPGRVVLGDYVTATDGTGLVHTAPPFGEDDYQTGARYGLPMWLTVDSEGKLIAGTGAFSGLWFKDADAKINQDLKARGLLLHAERTHHNYPFCWRCDQPLLYYANKSWFIRTTAKRDELVALNQQIQWHPAHVGEGRFGNWLENVVDWALSRKRYWGTPLPVWRCDGCAKVTVVGSYAALFAAAGQPLPGDVYDRTQFDPHRPFIDRMCWPCGSCAGAMRRVEEVIDAWFDSGAMPFAQHHYPFANRGAIDSGEQFPAQFIAEAVDQTRGWFYTLHAISTLLFGRVAYENCIVLGHVNDETGKKMSKRLGNVVEPMQVIEESGADALRWYFCVNNPEVPSRFSARLVREAAQNFLIPLWNALSFFTIYANLDGWRPGARADVPLARRPDLDRWLLLRLNDEVEKLTLLLDSYQIAESARRIETFVDDLTNWYIRRSRDRFWSSATEAGPAKESAYQTLYIVLTTMAKLIAPFTPFLAETMHAHLVRSQHATETNKPEPSVHLEKWPKADPDLTKADADSDNWRIFQGMNLTIRFARLGRTARNAHNLKTRQPLASVTLVANDPNVRPSVQGFSSLLADELNVKEVLWTDQRGELVHQEVQPNFPRLGKRLGRAMPVLQKWLAAADGDQLAGHLGTDGKLIVDLNGEQVELLPEDVEIRLVEKPGLATASDRELLVALDTALTPELVAEGLAREVVHHVQTARKDENFAYADRIRVCYRASEGLAAAIAVHRDWISGETLALDLVRIEGEAPESRVVAIEGHELSFSITKL
jgi:isoleucyl-tRNA synthetase